MTTSHTSRRRDFIKQAAGTAGAAALATGAFSNAHAASSNINRKLKIGAFGIDYTFWGLWADLLSPEGRYSGTSFLNMELSHVWDKDTKKAEEFANRWGCEVVKTYDGMIGKVDGVVNGGFYNIPWQHRLFHPYIAAGMPVFLDRPWSSRRRDLDEMLDLAAKNNTPVIATATYEHYNEADYFKQKLENTGEIEAVFATCSAGDRPHFHIPYMMMKILGYNVEEVSLMTNDPRKPSYLQTTYVYGATDSQPQYALSMQTSRAYVFWFTVIGRQGTETASMPGEASYFHRFMPQLIDIQKTFESKTNYQPLDIVRKKFDAVIAEYYSHYERGGLPVKVGSVPADWQYPLWEPDWYTDADFR